MRIRKLVAAALLAGAALFALAGPASAAPAKPKDEFTKECIEKLENGGAIDDCQQAPSPIKPATNELIWASISFFVLFFLLWKFAWPGLKKGLDQRSERIRSGLEEAEQARSEAERVLDEYRTQLADARNESARIIEEARQQADAMKRDLQSRAEAEITELRQRAAADVEAAKSQAVADMRAEVAELAVSAAEVVVQRSLDRDTQIQLIENYINQVGAARNG
ncbi:MAG TPA: F0F1 ATP synthase subunit B [Acidimicrobiales bacterium]|jgi:F-type H+-transporting ATPase subunit b